MYILRLGLFYPVTATTVVCCILMQILCVVSRKKLKLLRPPGPLLGLCPWTTLGDLTSSLLLCPPNNPVRLVPLRICSVGIRIFSAVTSGTFSGGDVAARQGGNQLVSVFHSLGPPSRLKKFTLHYKIN